MSGADHEHHHHHDELDHAAKLALRVKAIESLLVEKGLVDPDAMTALIDQYENRIGPHNGAKVVAKAWSDPEYKQRLLQDGSAAIAELGYSGLQGEEMVVVENSSTVHNFVQLLPVARPRLAAKLVQVRPVSLSRGDRSARRSRGIRRYRSTGRSGPGVGLQRRASVPRAAHASGRHGGDGTRRARIPGHA